MQDETRGAGARSARRRRDDRDDGLRVTVVAGVFAGRLGTLATAAFDGRVWVHLDGTVALHCLQMANLARLTDDVDEEVA